MGEPRTERRTDDLLTDLDSVRRVRAILVLGGVPSAELDDGVQQVRLKLIEQLSDPTRSVVDNPAAWAAVVASRLAVDFHRGRARDVQIRDRLAARVGQGDPGRSLDVDRTAALDVANVLDQLGPEHRQVVVLRYYADMQEGDIASFPGSRRGDREEQAAPGTPTPARRTARP